MEGHPIPQDVTGFQFKLIGDMTIKQFAYVAFGAVTAYVIFSLPVSIIIRAPFVALFALFGASLAFLPIGGRPMDTMAYNFLKALFNPSQYIYQKIGGSLFIQTAAPHGPNVQKEPSRRPVTFLRYAQRPKNKLDEKEMTFFTSLSSLFGGSQNIQTQAPQIITANVAQEKKEEPEEKPNKEDEEKRNQYLEKEAGLIKKELEEAKQEEKAEEGTQSYANAHEKVLELERQLSETVTQRQELERQLLDLQKRLSSQTKNVFTPSTATVKKQTRNVRSIPTGMGKSVGLPIAPEFPNMITGIVKDPRGNPLPNILIEVKDKDGSPVRAFKTNGLGQFKAATPLTNGAYTVEFEDPRGQNKFDAVEIVAAGEIILPIEIFSIDQREELRKSLFSQ